MESNRLPIALCADENYAPHAAVALYSASKNLHHDWHLDAYIVDCGFSVSTRNRFWRIARSRKITLHWIHPDLHDLEHLPRSSWVSVAGYARFLLPLVLPSGVHRIIYLDSDMLVRGDLSELISEGLGAGTLACQDTKYPLAACAQAADMLMECGMSSSDPYFNSGLLVIDLQNWRRNAIGEKVIALAERKGDEFTHQDQDAANIVLRGNWERLDSIWNVMSHDFLDEGCRFCQGREPRVVHFTGPLPDNKRCSNPYRSEYMDKLIESGWFGRFEIPRIRCYIFNKVIKIRRKWRADRGRLRY